MSCNGCRRHVEKLLSTVEGVEDVQVHFEDSEAHITGSVEINPLQNALLDDGGHYTIRNVYDLPIKKKQIPKPSKIVSFTLIRIFHQRS